MQCFVYQGFTPPTRKFKNRWLSTGHNQINKCKNYLKIILLIFLITGFGYNVNAQKNTEERKQLFEKEMNAYIITHLNEEIAEIKQNTDLIENFDEYTEEDIRSMAKENAKDKYIRNNMNKYLNTYFSNPQAMVTTDTFVCDNGGFEYDFLYYRGYTAENYFGGSTTCNPNVNFIPTPVLPVTNRLEIVTSGTDPLVGIQKVKFGNKALKINDRHGHINQCYGDRGVDKITKRFKVTKENRDFTIWYAVALENPPGHENRQPFLNIKCDLAPNDELCFDADFLKCEKYYVDSTCNNWSRNIDVLDWSCHRFKIPKEYIDSIATLEITVGDCGKGAHFGYAYIDGICEECDSSALGAASLNTVDYISCEEDTPPKIATVCGSFTLPTISSNCSNNPDPWQAVDIVVPGYEITNVNIFNNSNTFCFDFPETNFDGEDCLDIYVEIYFSNGIDTLPPQLSNSLEICQSKYEVVDCNGGGGPPIDTCDVVVDIQVGACQSNGTGGDNDDDQTPNMSDDYYYVYVSLYDPGELGWSIDRDLVDPYPNENDVFTIADGIGDTVSMILGPFLIQEGDWWMEFYLPGCNFSEYIEAPDYCSGCEEFRDAEIGNVTNCLVGDTWSFTLKVPNDHSTPFNPLRFKLNNLTDGVSGFYSYNDTHTSPNLSMGSGCKVFTMEDENNTQCVSGFTICPPKPCNDECIDFNVHVEEMECIFDERSQQYTGYEVLVDISGIDESEQKVCISYVFASDPGQIPIQWGSLSNGLRIIGPFDSDIYLTFSVCPKNENCPCSSTTCFKTIYIPKPDCITQKEIEKREQKKVSEENNMFENTPGDLLVIPNPFNSNEVFLQSTLKRTKFEIYDLSGRMIQHGEFEGEKHRISFNELPGIYFIKYVNKIGNPSFVKMIKL